MLKTFYRDELKRALFVRGVWGKEAVELEERLIDHYDTAIEGWMENGETRESAERQALEALGQPEDLASAAAANLGASRWVSRHPWLLAGGGLFVGLLVFEALLVCAAARGLSFTNRGALADNVGSLVIMLSGLFHWLPFAIGSFWLAFWGRRSPGSWKPLIIGAVSLGLVCSFYHVDIVLNGPGSGRLIVNTNTWFSGLVVLLQKLLPNSLLPGFMASEHLAVERFLNGLVDQGGALVRMTAPFIVVMAARYWPQSHVEDRKFA